MMYVNRPQDQKIDPIDRYHDIANLSLDKTIFSLICLISNTHDDVNKIELNKALDILLAEYNRTENIS